MQETWVQSLGREDPLKEGMATHSRILAWRILMDREKPGGLSPWGCKESDMTEWLSIAHTAFLLSHRFLSLNWWEIRSFGSKCQLTKRPQSPSFATSVFGPQAPSVYLWIQCISVSVYSVYLRAVTPLQSVRGKKIFPFACDKSPSVTNLSSHIWNSGLISSGRPHSDTFLVMHKTRPNCHPGKAEGRHTPRLHCLD